ncbi:hypothetical protein WJX73_008832 [Symbiochloris irregularis]|uniref:BRCT domain-containing protein n=1 Tax=Symbiochloris irregularis TaxID=706552 RepID=A0AAW1NTM0_9CHLO
MLTLHIAAHSLQGRCFPDWPQCHHQELRAHAVNYERAPSEEALPAGNAGAHGKPAALNAPRPRPAMVSSTSDPYRYPESQTPRDYQLPTPAINLGPLSGKFEGEAEVGVEGAGAMEGEMVEFSKAISGRKVSAAHAGTAIQDGGENYQPGFAMMTLMMAASTVTTHTRVTWTTRMQQLNALQPQAPCIPAVPIAYGPDAETPARKKATVKLGCSKCRYSRNGCGKCRPAGMVVTPLLRGRKRIRPSSAAEPSSEEPSPVHAPAPKRLRTGLEQPQQRTAQHEILPAAAAAAGAHHAQRRQLGPPHIFGNQAFLLSGFDNAERQQLQKDAKLHGGRILQSISACMEGSLEGCRVVVLASDGAKQTTKQMYGAVCGHAIARAEWLRASRLLHLAGAAQVIADTSLAFSPSASPAGGLDLIVTHPEHRDAVAAQAAGIPVRDTLWINKALMDRKLPEPLPQPASAPALPSVSEACDLGPPSQDWANPPPPPSAAAAPPAHDNAPTAQAENHAGGHGTPRARRGSSRKRKAHRQEEQGVVEKGRQAAGPLRWIGSPCTAPARGAQRTFYKAFMLDNTEVRSGDVVRLKPALGGEAGAIVQLETLWSERLASGRDCMLATARRFQRPEDTMFVSTKDPMELFATNQQEERLKLSHVLAPCPIQMRQPPIPTEGGSDLADENVHFCMYHFDHRNNSLRPLNQ